MVLNAGVICGFVKLKLAAIILNMIEKTVWSCAAAISTAKPTRRKIAQIFRIVLTGCDWRLVDTLDCQIHDIWIRRIDY